EQPTGTGGAMTSTPSVPGTGGAPSTVGGAPGRGGSTPAGTGGAPPTTECVGSTVAAPKRLIRLTFNQIVSSVRAIFGAELATTLSTTFEIGDPTERTFPPLGSPREGSVVTDSVWSKNDGIAQRIGEYVSERFATVTPCGDAPTDACAEAFVTELAAKAFRRPITDEERAALLGVYTGVRNDGGSIPEATQYATYAIFGSPHFLYRPEFGSGATVEGPLAPYEMASQLSYFLTDGPPDAELLEAARNDALGTREQLEPHVARLLASEATRVNLQTALFAYFGIPMLDTVVVDPAKAPDFTAGLRNAMYREAQLFLNDTLWNRPLTDVLTSRRSFVNPGLAALYGLDFSQFAAGADADGFAPVTLPENRAGLVTMAGFLTARSRPDTPSVVGRGLVVNATLLCAQNPPFPEGQAAEIDAVSAMLEHETERAKAQYRAETAPCFACHQLFDQYGVALENYDVIGRYRTVDEQGRPIDASVTLPDAAGGAFVENAVQMAEQFAQSGAFVTCMAKNLIGFALAEGANVDTTSCSTRAVVERYAAGEPTFATLVREVALSETLALRARGGS
ncbi:MAG: DUF1592 domain-containing protein, partial [Pseudomonadota bacterium]